MRSRPSRRHVPLPSSPDGAGEVRTASRPGRRPGLLRGVAGLLLVVLLASACGSDDDPSDEASGGGVDPVTVDHQYGSTTLDGVPERIVSLDTQWTDVLLALGTPPVATPEVAGVDGGVLPWQELPGSVELLAADGGIPFEQIAALQPDLIVGTYLIADQATYDQLTGIAPTIGLLSGGQVDPWQDIAATAGDLLGASDDADALVREAEQASADLLAELPGLEGRDYTLANYVPGDSIYVVADPDDGASTVFAQLGMAIDPDLVALADGASGRVQVSLEQIGLLDSDLLVLLTNGAEPGEIPGYSGLPAVQSGAVAVLDLGTVIGLNTPTPLSVPYALDAIRPALEAAAGAATAP